VGNPQRVMSNKVEVYRTHILFVTNGRPAGAPFVGTADRTKWMLIWLLHLWTPAGSASFGSIRCKGPTQVHHTASGVTTNQFDLSSYRGWILESIIPTMGITRAISSERKMSCTRRIKNRKFPGSQELEKLISVWLQNKSTGGLKYEWDSLINTNCASQLSDRVKLSIHTIKVFARD
jgi:hypothetical protein